MAMKTANLGMNKLIRFLLQFIAKVKYLIQRVRLFFFRELACEIQASSVASVSVKSRFLEYCSETLQGGTFQATTMIRV